MSIAVALLAFVLPAFQAEVPYRHQKPEFELRLPSPKWTKTDQSAGNVLTCIFSPVADMTTRCTVLAFPRVFLPKGLETREAQIRKAAGKIYERVAMEPETRFEREVQRWEYTIAGATTIEWAFEDGDSLVIFQLAAPAATWADEKERAALDAIRDSFEWTGGDVDVKAGVDATPPSTIRERRRDALAASAKRPIEVTRHSVRAKIEPAARSLEVDDAIEVVAREDGARVLKLYSTVVEIDRVECDAKIEWKVEPRPNANTLTIEFAEPLAVDATHTLRVHAAAKDFFLAQDQQLVAEIAVLGQVRPRSSWSTHVLWYPIEAQNDAEVELAFDVPAPYVAVTGGRLVEQKEDAGRRVYRYAESSRVARQLPFGFAVGEYESREIVSAAGLKLGVFGFAGEEKRIEQRIDALEMAAAAFESAFGPLPWKDVRFVHVKPERKETGVSLPGMILVSDQYFPDLEDVDLSDGELDDPVALGLLVIADELSHQWNFYAAGFPNELAEGISTFTNALFVERRHGKDAYDKAIAYCRRAWIESAGLATEFAIANPAVYSNVRYRSVVFCKTPVVLDALRRRLGDEAFFAGFRAAFQIADRKSDGFERLEQGFEKASGLELRPFFDQWFFRAGFPTLAVEHEATADGALITIRQTQDEDSYVMDVELEVRCEDGSTHWVPVTITAKENVLPLNAEHLPAPAKSVAIARKDVLPARTR